MQDDPPTFDDATMARVLAVKSPKDRAFVDELVSMLATLDRGLLQPAAHHPFAHLLALGVRGIDPLLDAFDKGDPRQQRDALDALAHLIVGTSGGTSAPQRLKAALRATQDVELAALLEKTLALAGDESTLFEQMKRLTDDDPGVVASAARLLGFGRYAPAVPALKALVSPERIYESRWVIWALGEIGDASALPALEIALAHAFRVVDCLIAMGKIGRITSIPQLTPHLVGGFGEQKDAAVRALAMILDTNRDDKSAIAPLRAQLGSLLERELADAAAPLPGSTRFHMLLCLARLGHKLDETRVKKYLGGSFAPASGRNVAALRMRPVLAADASAVEGGRDVKGARGTAGPRGGRSSTSLPGRRPRR